MPVVLKLFLNWNVSYNKIFLCKYYSLLICMKLMIKTIIYHVIVL